jgi:hypothetical protein
MSPDRDLSLDLMQTVRHEDIAGGRVIAPAPAKPEVCAP